MPSVDSSEREIRIETGRLLCGRSGPVGSKICPVRQVTGRSTIDAELGNIRQKHTNTKVT